MGHALRVRIIFDRVSFLVYFLKCLWSITRWDNFRLCIISGLYSKVVMFNHTLGSILIEYHVRSNLLKVCFVASYHFLIWDHLWSNMGVTFCPRMVSFFVGFLLVALIFPL